MNESGWLKTSPNFSTSASYNPRVGRGRDGTGKRRGRAVSPSLLRAASPRVFLPGFTALRGGRGETPAANFPPGRSWIPAPGPPPRPGGHPGWPAQPQTRRENGGVPWAGPAGPLAPHALYRSQTGCSPPAPGRQLPCPGRVPILCVDVARHAPTKLAPSPGRSSAAPPLPAAPGKGAGLAASPPRLPAAPAKTLRRCFSPNPLPCSPTGGQDTSLPSQEGRGLAGTAPSRCGAGGERWDARGRGSSPAQATPPASGPMPGTPAGPGRSAGCRRCVDGLYGEGFAVRGKRLAARVRPRAEAGCGVKIPAARSDSPAGKPTCL